MIDWTLQFKIIALQKLKTRGTMHGRDVLMVEMIILAKTVGGCGGGLYTLSPLPPSLSKPSNLKI
jgi:hypothetical protein